MNRNPNTAPMPSLENGAVPAILKGIACALLLSLALLLIASLILYFTALPERYAPYIVFAASVFAILWGSSYAGKRIGHQGWLYGGLVGLFYVLLMLIVGLLLLNDFNLGFNIFTKLFLGFAFGAVGGIWGVNVA